MKTVKFSFFLALIIVAQCMTSLMAQYTPISNPIFSMEGGSLQGYTLQGQKQDQWCWAASGAMVMEYVSSSDAPTQCAEATKRHGGDCCNNGSSSTCNKGSWPQLSEYGYSSTTTNDAPLTFEEIKTALKANSPICFSWFWAGTGNGGHMMTVSGWAIIQGTKYVYVNDPWPVNKGTTKYMTYDAYVKGSNYTHGPDIYNITR